MESTGGFVSPPMLLTRTAAFVAVGVALGYLLAPVPNIELVTATCFCAGYLLGFGAGVFCSIMIEALFAGFHPMGSSLGLMLLAQCIGMAGAGGIGAACRPLSKRSSQLTRTLLVVLSGVTATIWFDFLTNLAFPITAGFTFEQTMASFIMGAPFAAIHVTANLLVFLFVVAPVLPKLVSIIDNPS